MRVAPATEAWLYQVRAISSMILFQVEVCVCTKS
jgi:hypothetical protein